MRKGLHRFRRFTKLAVLLLPLALVSIPRVPASLADLASEPDGLTHFWARDGVLEVTLRAAKGKIHVGDLELDGMTYNGDYAGPVMHIHPGDLLRLRLINNLPQPTNIHFHGYQGSPLFNSDNAHLSIAANTSFTYEYHIPMTQSPGVYYYHSHLHGMSEQQVMGGLSGAVVIEPPEGTPPGPVERLFVLKDIVYDDDVGNPTIDDELHGVVQSINGRLDTIETIRPGETRLWRFTNQSADRPFHIAVEGHKLQIVAQDGEPSISTQPVDVIDITPSGRVDVLIDGGAPGTYALLSKGAMTGSGADRKPDRVLGHLIVSGDPPTRARSWRATAPPPDLRGIPINASRTIVFTQVNSLKASEQRFYFNGRLFDPLRVDFRVPLGNVEEWTVRNDSDDLHVFHIHQLAFQVVAINGVAAPYTGRLDNVRVPEHGSVTLRMAFSDPLIVGRFMVHCHVLKHEDKGMMGQVEVYDPRGRTVLARGRQLYLHFWWWMHGVPWNLCGLGYS